MLGKAQQQVLHNTSKYPHAPWAIAFSYNTTLKAMTFLPPTYCAPNIFRFGIIFIDFLMKHFSQLHPSTVPHCE